MSHPTLWDKLARKIYPRYLYKGETAIVQGKIYVGVVHRLPEVQKPFWKVSQYVNIENGSQLRYVGLVRQLGFEGDVEKNNSIFELVNPIIEHNLADPITITKGDTICVDPSDRQYIFPNISLQFRPSSLPKS